MTFLHVYRTILNFITDDLSSFYLDFAKDVVYIEEEDSYERRCMQTVFYQATVAIAKLLTPIVPHTAEEIWSYVEEEEEYVQLTDFPAYQVYSNQEELMDIWTAFMNFRDKVLKALEIARNEKLIGKSMEAKVTIYPNEQVSAMLNAVDANIAQLLIVSPDFFTIKDANEKAPEEAVVFEDVAIMVEKADGEVCQRCRQMRTSVGENEHFPTMCAHCAAIVEDEHPEAIQEGFE
ncbi:isoleucyl-tRNA synthetase [Tetragenococcus muriaticus PMC-11-5]|uniref:Isoleucyl-tRNA synthetase n=1 Tax=Tetragenococcus muriaticus PMC-11-5 TaxID=1302649 RepID=A0A091C478_9ENTE|nr:isoleucyl-tRNA synthetase [Tetragenococcus muriaticus PMC-11-5]